jgi:capsular exopolysaccharide synthesis family protein
MNRIDMGANERLDTGLTAPPESDKLDLKSILFVVQRRSRLILSIIVGVMALTLFLTSQLNDVYTASARVLIDTRDRQIIDDKIAAAARPDSTLMDTEVKLIMSRKVMNRVSKQLNLVEDPEFNPLLTKRSAFEKFTDDASAWLARLASPRGSPETIATTEDTDDDAILDTESTPAERLAFKLSTDQLERTVLAYRDGLTFVIQVKATSQDPEKAAAIANAVVNAYIDGQLESRVAETQKASDWLEQRLDVLRNDVRDAEKSVETFRSEQGIVEAGGVSTIEAKIGALTPQLLILQADLVEKQSRYSEALRYAGTDAASADNTDVISSPLLTILRGERSGLARKFAEISAQYEERHPEYIRATTEMADLNKSIEQERSRILSGLKSDVEVARSRVTAVESSLNEQNGQLRRSNIDQIAQRELEREANASRVLYESLLGRAAEVTQAVELQQSDAYLAAAAEVPSEPSAPDHKLNILLGLVASLAMAGLTVLILEFLETGFVSADDIERDIGVPVITTVAEARGLKLLKSPTVGDLLAYLKEKPYSAYANAIRSLYAEIHKHRVNREAFVVAFTSSLPGEGKTTMSLCLARMAAGHGERVLLVDGDIHHRSLSALLATDTDAGFLEALSSRVDPLSAIQEVKDTELKILPAATTRSNDLTVILQEDCRTLFDKLKSDFDLIIVDCPPALPVLEASTISSAADIALFASRWKKTDKKAIRRAVRLLASHGANVAGIVLTRADLRKQALYEQFNGEHYKLYSAYYHD